jgi:hypothetical protein
MMGKVPKGVLIMGYATFFAPTPNSERSKPYFLIENCKREQYEIQVLYQQ